MTCLSCNADTSNGLALCDLCRRKVTTDLEFLPIYFRNLTRWRPSHVGSRPVPGSRPPKGAFVETAQAETGADTVARALNDAGVDLATWAGKLAYERTDLQLPDELDEAATVAASCTLLADNLTTVATLDWAGQLVTRLRQHEARLRRLTEQIVPGWYAGACKNCGYATHVVPGLTWTTCTVCGTTTAARDHLDTVLTEARDWIARPMPLAAALVALLDTEQSQARLHKRIAAWGERERIPTYRRRDRDGDEIGPKRYRLGDVLDRLGADGPTADNTKNLRSRLARPGLIATLIVTEIDSTQDRARLASRIRQWGSRGPRGGGIPSHRERDEAGVETGPRLFRVGDVLDRLDLSGSNRENFGS